MFSFRRPVVIATIVVLAAGSAVVLSQAGADHPASAAVSTLAFSHGVVVDQQRVGFEPDVKVAGTPVGSTTTDPAGTIYTSVPFGFSTTQSFLWSSLDGGNSYQPTPGNVGPGKPTTCVGGGDTDLFLDPANNLYFSDLQGLTNISQSVSSDGGKTFTTNCAGVPNTPDDRMWFTGTGTLNGTGAGAQGPLNLYEDFDTTGNQINPNNAGGNQLVEAISHDGVTFQPVTNSNAAANISSGSPDCLGASIQDCVTGNEGISGNQVVDPSTGNLYIAHTTLNGDTGGEAGVAVAEGKVTSTSTPATASWTESPNLDGPLCPDPSCVDSAGNPEEISGQNFSVIARDSAGYLYVAFAAAPLDHNSTDANFGGQTAPPAVYIVHSLQPAGATPSAVTFSAPQRISGAGTNVFPWLVAGDNGRVDVAWYHTDEVSESGPCTNTTSMTCTLFGASSLNQAEWTVQLAQSLNASASSPSYQTTTVTEHSVKYGAICTSGLGCATGGDRSLGDFLQVNIDNRGAAVVSYVDDTSADTAAGENSGPEEIANQIGGPSLLSSVGTVAGPGAGPGVPYDSVNDPMGDDAYSANGTRTAGGPNLDITGALLTGGSDGNLTAVINVKSLASLSVSPSLGGPDVSYILRWTEVAPGTTGNGHIYYVGMDTNSGTPSFFAGDTSCIPGPGNPAEHCKYLTFPQTHVLTASQAQYNATTGTIAIKVPLSDVGSPSVGTTLYSATAFSATSTVAQSATTIFNLIDSTTPFDHVVGQSGTTGTTTTTAAGGTTTTTNANGGSTPNANRLSGPDRVATAIAVSQASYPSSDSAQTATLARSDQFPDALAGGPFALDKGGPLLLSESGQLDSATLSEIKRVLPSGATVYLLGGTGALSASVESSITGAGYKAVRVSGADRYATAVAIANAIGPSTILEASGLDFPDALASGPAAVQSQGAVLLTAGSTMPSVTQAYIKAHSSDPRYAVGGPAAQADPGAKAVVGSDRYATSAAVAGLFFPSPSTVGLATGLDFPDASTSAPLLGSQEAPVVLVQPTGSLPPSVNSYLSSHNGTISLIEVFGGTSAVSDQVESEAVSAG